MKKDFTNNLKQVKEKIIESTIDSEYLPVYRLAKKMRNNYKIIKSNAKTETDAMNVDLSSLEPQITQILELTQTGKDINKFVFDESLDLNKNDPIKYMMYSFAFCIVPLLGIVNLKEKGMLMLPEWAQILLFTSTMLLNACIMFGNVHKNNNSMILEERYKSLVFKKVCQYFNVNPDMTNVDNVPEEVAVDLDNLLCRPIRINIFKKPIDFEKMETQYEDVKRKKEFLTKIHIDNYMRRQ
jgi:hypothetical protein